MERLDLGPVQPLPLVKTESDASLLAKDDPFALEEQALVLASARVAASADPSLGVDDPMPGDMLALGKPVQGPADRARRLWIADDGCDLAIGRHSAVRDQPNDLIHARKEAGTTLVPTGHESACSLSVTLPRGHCSTSGKKGKSNQGRDSHKAELTDGRQYVARAALAMEGCAVRARTRGGTVYAQEEEAGLAQGRTITGVPLGAQE